MGLELVPLLLGGLAIVVLTWGVQTRRTLGRIPAHWLAVTGTVVDAGRPQLVSYRTTDGRQVQLRGMLDPGHVAGQDVEVLVDPVDQTRARLVETDRAAAAVARNLLVLGVVLAAAAALSAIAFG